MSSARQVSQSFSCGCIGPQRGEPLCPCKMRGMKKRDGRWIRPEMDMGPVRSEVVADFLAKVFRSANKMEK